MLARCGAQVTAVDKAPLDPAVAALANVRWRGESAFGLEPDAFDPVDWLCSDIVAYPNRLVGLIERWVASGRVANIICTIKFQGTTDHAAVASLAGLEGAQLFHLHHNKHELTFTWVAPS